jgi:hypothetical protein
MICETCRWSGRPGFVRIAQNVQQDPHCELIPCTDCGGQGIGHWRDGICERPNVDPAGQAHATPLSPELL